MDSSRPTIIGMLQDYFSLVNKLIRSLVYLIKRSGDAMKHTCKVEFAFRVIKEIEWQI